MSRQGVAAIGAPWRGGVGEEVGPASTVGRRRIWEKGRAAADLGEWWEEGKGPHRLQEGRGGFGAS